MGLLDKIKNSDFTGLNRAFGGGKHSESSGYDEGIRGGPQTAGRIPGGRGMPGWAENPMVAIGIRGAQIFFLLIGFFIFIAISSFQSSNDVGPSGLTILSILVIVLALLHSIAFVVVPLIYERTGKLKSAGRAFSNIRVGFVVNTTWSTLLLLLFLINAISANVKGCRDPASDPNASKEGYIDKLPTLCRNKRAATAFLFFSFAAYVATLFLVFLDWQRARRDGPRIPGFNQPSAGFQRTGDGDEEAEAFRPPEDDDEDIVTSRYDDAPRLPMSQQGGGGAVYGQQGGLAAARPSGTFYDRPLFSEAAPAGYGAGAGGQAQQGGMDEYDRIRQSLSFDRPVGYGDSQQGQGHAYGQAAPTLPPVAESGPPLYQEGAYR